MSEPRVQAVQTMLRLIYEDGTVGMVASTPSEVIRDDLELEAMPPVHDVLKLLEAQHAMLHQRVEYTGLDELYRQVKKEASDRRAEVVERADEAHRQNQLRPENLN